MAAPASEVSLHFLDYWRVIRNRAAIIITVLLLTLMTGYVVTVYVMQKMYDAKAQVRVYKEKADIDVFDKRTDGPFDVVFFTGEISVIQSKKILNPVIEKLNLQKEWGTRLFSGSNLPMDKAYLLLRNRVDIDYQRNSDILEIRVKSDVPAEAATVANAIVDVYSEMRRTEQLSKQERGFKTFDEEIGKQAEVVQRAKDNVERLRKELNIDVIESGGESGTQMIEEEWKRKSALLDDVRAEYLGRQVRFEKLARLPTNEFLDAIVAMGIEDANLTSLRAKKYAAESDLEQMRKSGLEGNHPRIKSREAELTKIDEQVNANADGKRRALEIDVQVTKARMLQLEKDVEALTVKVRQQKTGDMSRFREAIKERDRQQVIYDQLFMRKKQEQASRSIIDEPVMSISKAEPTDIPFRPNLTINLIASGVAGLVLGIVLAFFIEYLDTSVKTMDDVEKLLDLPVLAVIPDGVGPLIREGADSPHAEGYRILRAKIDLNPKSGAGNTLTVVSGGPGEGKSTTLFNLAYVCAQSGQSVLLVDADLRRPTVHNILGIENEAGVSEAMRGIGEAHQYIRATSIPNMHVITAGDMPASEMGSFSGLKLREILNDLKLRYDIVLLDAPPVLGISDGAVLAHEVDFTLLVIQHRRYPRDISMRAKRAVEEVKGNLLGVVLNAVAVKSDEAYYYYSSYGNYYYNRNGEKKPRSGVAKPQRATLAKGEEHAGGSEDF